MSKALNIGLGLALVGVVVLVATQGNKILNQFAVRIKGYGTPRLNFSSWVLTLPVKIEFNNPTPAPINLNNVSGTVSLMKETKFQPVVNFNQSLSIPPGKNDSTITTEVNLKQFFANNFVAASLEILTTGKLRIRTNITVNYAGITITPEPLDNVVDVA